MILLFTSWIILYFISAVFGFRLVQAISPDSVKCVSQTEIVLAGLSVLVIIAQVTSLIWPTDYRLVAVFALGAALINWQLANRPLRAASASLYRLAREPLAWLLLGAVLVFNICRVWYFDSGVYHLPSILWYEQLRATPGLGNLHGRLAFNSSFFVLSAAFGFTNLLQQTLFALNGFMLLLFCAYVIRRIARPETVPGLRGIQLLMMALGLYYLLYAVSSPTPDVWATLLPLFIVFFWLDKTPDRNAARPFLLVILILLCVTVKLGTVPLLLFLPILFVTHRRSFNTRQGLLLLAVSSLLVVPWLIRNVILSGYLLYPLPSLDLFAVDWKIPLPAVQHEADYVVFWARFHINEMEMDTSKLAWPITRWLPIWWRAQGEPETFFYYKLNRPLFVAAGVSPLLMAFQGLRSGRLQPRLWQAYVVGFAGFLFWFLKAPEFRFGLPFIWMAALLPWVPLLGRLPQGITGQPAVWVLGGLMVWFSAKLLYIKHPLTARSLVIPTWYGYRDVAHNESVRYQPYRTQSGLVVVMPQAGHFEQRCFECQPLCSPYFVDDLEMRGTSPEAGFRRRPLPNPLHQTYTSESHDAQHHHPGF